jgi:hypothetical protein
LADWLVDFRASVELKGSTTNRVVTHQQQLEKKLTPMEKLKLKMRAAFDDQSRQYEESNIIPQSCIY